MLLPHEDDRPVDWSLFAQTMRYLLPGDLDGVAIAAMIRAKTSSLPRVLRGLGVAYLGTMDTNQRVPLLLTDLTSTTIGAFYDVYNELAGFPEFVVRRAMAIALQDAGLLVREEVDLPVWFRGHRIVKFRADLIVQPGLLVEVKVRPEIDSFNKAQLLHYLKATDLEVGLLLNFGRKPEFTRIIYENARKRPRIEMPENLERMLVESPTNSGDPTAFDSENKQKR
jgi:GxxExxY protein